MYDITRFSLADMTRCGATLRRMGEDSTSMEEVAGKMVQYLYHEMTDGDSVERSFGLVRIFKTHDYGDLDSQLQGIVVKVLGREPESPGTKCLTLLATVTSMNNVSFGRGPCAPPLQAHVGTERLVARSETLLPQGGSHVSAMPCYRLGAWSQGDPFLCARRLDGAMVPPCQRTCVVGLP